MSIDAIDILGKLQGILGSLCLEPDALIGTDCIHLNAEMSFSTFTVRQLWINVA